MKLFVWFVSKDNKPVPEEKVKEEIRDEHLLRHFRKYPIKKITWGKGKGFFGAMVEFEKDTDGAKALMGKNKQNLEETPYKTMIEMAGRDFPFRPETEAEKEKSRLSNISYAYNESAVNVSGRKEKRFPYDFVKRRNYEPDIYVRHDLLEEEHFDIAFEICWIPLSPIALNPCLDLSSPKDPAIPDELEGLERRWLIIEDHLIISPFTVKSAIANAYANLMGACYRVTNRPKGHAEVEEGTYPYSGCYKRYRVAMNHSKPGIVKEIRVNGDGSRFIRIQPVRELFYRGKELTSLKVGEKVAVELKRNIVTKVGDGGTEAYYAGPYRFGMNLELKAPDLGCKTYHRFYEPHGEELKGTLPAYHFWSLDEMKKHVYAGVFKRVKSPDPRSYRENGPWYEDLTGIKEGDFVYYQAYERNGKKVITNIGKNFQFKAIFHHEEAVPPGHELCRDIKKLCPRCKLFGITQGETGDETSLKEKDTVGYRGRFLSSGLISNVKINPAPIKIYCKIPAITNDRNKIGKLVDIKVLKWNDREGREICRQFLMPLMLGPKPSKRDIDLYYDKTTGYIKGAKRYLKAIISWKELENKINEINNRLDLNEKSDPIDYKYGHRFRRFAMVARPDNLYFSGTVGVSQASAYEIAALMILLHTPEFKNAFQVGLGKPLGLGTVESRITGVWIRTRDNYKWEHFIINEVEGKDWNELINWVEERIPKLRENIEDILKAARSDKLLDFSREEASRIIPEYPSPGNKYVKYAKELGFGK